MNNEPLIVKKNRKLLALSRSKLSLTEFKILDCFLAKIDMHHPENRTIVLQKGEVEAALGVKRIHPQQLSERLDRLGDAIRVPISETEYDKYWLLEYAKCKQDDHGHWTVTMTVNQRSMEYFFNYEKIGYLRYKLRNIAELTSRYSYLLFLYLEDNRFRGSWTVSIDKLRQAIDCVDVTYDQYKFFRQSVLQKCWKEITSKTECQYDYSPVKENHGHKYTAIKFTVHPLEDSENISDLISEDDENIVIPDKNSDQISEIPLYRSATDMSFTDDELIKIAEAVESVDIEKLPNTGSNLARRKMLCVADKYRAMREQIQTIRSPLSYICTAIRNADYRPSTDEVQPDETATEELLINEGNTNNTSVDNIPIDEAIFKKLTDYNTGWGDYFTDSELLVFSVILSRIPHDKLPEEETELLQRIQYFLDYFDILDPIPTHELMLALTDALRNPIDPNKFTVEQVQKLKECQQKIILAQIKKEVENK